MAETDQVHEGFAEEPFPLGPEASPMAKVYRVFIMSLFINVFLTLLHKDTYFLRGREEGFPNGRRPLPLDRHLMRFGPCHGQSTQPVEGPAVPSSLESFLLYNSTGGRRIGEDLGLNEAHQTSPCCSEEKASPIRGPLLPCCRTRDF